MRARAREVKERPNQASWHSDINYSRIWPAAEFSTRPFAQTATPKALRHFRLRPLPMTLIGVFLVGGFWGFHLATAQLGGLCWAPTAFGSCAADRSLRAHPMMDLRPRHSLASHRASPAKAKELGFGFFFKEPTRTAACLALRPASVGGAARQMRCKRQRARDSSGPRKLAS